MLIAWFGSLVSVIFAYMYTETYHPVGAPLTIFHLNVYQNSQTATLINFKNLNFYRESIKFLEQPASY